MSEEIIRKIVRYLGNECNSAEAEEVSLWKKENPEEFEQLKKIYRFTPFETLHFESVDLNQLLGKVSEQRTDPAPRERKRPFRSRNILKIAASVMILMVAGLTMLYVASTKTVTENVSAARMTVKLPDGSTVVLDRGAILSYRTSIRGAFDRELTLDGRGYFAITRDKMKSFDIHTENADIRVLGTRFSVSGDGERTQVVLEEGKVRVTSPSKDESIDLLQSGAQVIFNQDGLSKQNMVNKHLYMSWLNDKLEFNHCSVEEALEFLSDTWDIRVTIENPDNTSTRLYGSAPSDDPMLIVRAIELITNQEITVTK